MDRLRGLPDRVTELIDLSKAYLRQETLEPARRLGRMAGFSLGAAALLAIGGVLVAVAGMRALTGMLGASWTWAGYLISGVLLAGVAGGVLWMGRR